MTDGRRWLLTGLLAGALLRGLLLPLPGTGDVLIWKVWSFTAAHDVTGLYGVGGSPPERRVLRWQGVEMTVDYPPVSLYELAIAGRLYRAVRPLFDDSPLLNVAVKLPGLIAEIVLVALLYRFCREEAGEAAAVWAALAVWLNPAVLLDSPALGYLDSQMAVPAVLAALAAWRGRPALAGALMAVAVLTKAQAVFVVPVVAALAVRRTPGVPTPGVLTPGVATPGVLTPGVPTPGVLRLAAAGLATAGVVLLPFVVRGAWSNMVQALSRLALHDALSAQAANIWWIVTWILRVQDAWTELGAWAALTQQVRILAISRVIELGYPSARAVGLVLVAGAVTWAALRAFRAVRTADAVALAAWSLYSYALFAAQVHENHLAPAVLLLAPAAAIDVRYRRVFWLLTTIVALNLYLFYGLGEGWPPAIGRGVTLIDATVVLSVANVVTFAWLTAIIGRRRAAGVSS